MGNASLEQPKKVVALQEGLLTSASQEASLIGSKCRVCGFRMFPERAFCGRCCSSQVEEVVLSKRGRIFSFCVVERKPSLSLIEAPYIMVEVEMPEGVRVFSVLGRCDPQAVKIGMEVEMAVEKFTEDKNGNDVVSYTFRPAKRGKYRIRD